MQGCRCTSARVHVIAPCILIGVNACARWAADHACRHLEKE